MSQEITDKIRAAASAKGIDPELALSIARAESSLTPTARAKTSTAGGLFQVIDDTWKQHGGKPGKKFDVDENIRVGTDVIAKNARQLKSALGRDPSNADIYAAHHFGATGAAQLLSADPATPIDQVFSGKVIQANPHLKGKTSGEVVAQLEAKVGKSSKASPTQTSANVSRETPTPAEEVMTPALRSGMTAKLQDLGPSYQAALALSMLSDSDDTKGEKDIDSEPSVAEQWLAQQSAPLPALAELANMRIRSPFPEPQQPVMMNEGGDASTAAQMLRGLVPMDIRTFGATLAGDRSPITEANFNPDELAAMQQAVDKAAARTGRTQKGSVQYEDYPRGEEIGPGYQPVGHTLGRFTYEKSPTGQTTISDTYDFYNEGRKANVEAYEKMGGMEKTGTVAYRMLKNMLKMDPRAAMNELGDAAIGRDGRQVRIQLPVRRANGSPKEGEATEPTAEELAAASRPAFLTPKSGIGRKISTKPGEIEAAALQGVSETPYNVLGAPVDLATMAMRPFGYDVKAPVGGSDWIKEKMTALGIRPEAPTQPTQRAFYELGQLGGSLINPAAPVRGAVAGAQATGKAAKELLQDFQQYNRALDVPGASYAVKPRGGTVLYTHTGEGGPLPISKLDDLIMDYRMAAARDEGASDELVDFIKQKAPKYFTTVYGTADDPLRTAIRERAIEPFGRDLKKIPPYLVDAAKFPQARGHLQAKQDLERLYDEMTGVNPWVLKPEDRVAPGSMEQRRMINQKMAQEGVPVEAQNAPSVDAYTRGEFEEYPSSTRMLRQLVQAEGQLPSNIQHALRTGEPMYDISPNFDLLSPSNVVDALKQVPVNKLKNMSFADALIQGTQTLAPIRDYRTAIDMADRGAKIPPAVLQQFTKEVAPAQGGLWVQITSPVATELEGKLMKHSVGGYSAGEQYGTGYTGLPYGGKKAFDEGLVRVFSLRDKAGEPTITVEMARPKGQEGWNVTQVRGRFNSEPADKQSVFDLFDKIDSTEGLGKIKSNSYTRSATGADLDRGTQVDWGREYDLWKQSAE